MKTPRTDVIIREIALRHDVSCEKVTSELAAAIDYGFASTDPHAKIFWKSIGAEENEPAFEDLILSLAALSVIRCSIEQQADAR